MVKDTSIEYDDMVGYEAEDETSSLAEFIGSEKVKNQKEIRPKPVDPDFPESWQNLVVAFRDKEDYFAFMNLIDEPPVMKTSLVYEPNVKKGLENFF